MKAKKPRKCSVCGSTEHRADFHGSKKERALLPSIAEVLTGDDALRSLVIPEMAIYIVLSDQLSMAISGAVRAHEKAPQSSTSLISAYTRLAERAATISKNDLERARQAWQRLLIAQADYDRAIDPIKAAIIPPKKG